ncbi:hypothetical protein F2P81_010157 [Scophthalmus maximus]|uniref:Uncharacterized protein n=1 Tax=Scophthalmus maximus TaxID=52904 RepID=A0A6A4STJ6_SCOMX|nr:hypothetical protein F2P81_010157 [Scophthalmus maximus]
MALQQGWWRVLRSTTSCYSGFSRMTSTQVSRSYQTWQEFKNGAKRKTKTTVLSLQQHGKIHFVVVLKRRRAQHRCIRSGLGCRNVATSYQSDGDDDNLLSKHSVTSGVLQPNAIDAGMTSK